MAMTISEIRQASARQLADARADAAHVSETTPPTITPTILAFARGALGGDPVYVPVVDDGQGLYGWCSDGVHQKVLADGGRPVFGWTLWEWPEALITAEFHAVWENPDGIMLDITPKPGREASILFVPDQSYPADFDFDQRPRNRRARLYEGSDRIERARAIAAGLSGTQRTYEERRAAKANLPLEEWLLRKVPTDPLPEAIDALIDICNEFEAHHDTLGASGLIVPDDKFLELASQRMLIQGRFKSLYSVHKAQS